MSITVRPTTFTKPPQAKVAQAKVAQAKVAQAKVAQAKVAPAPTRPAQARPAPVKARGAVKTGSNIFGTALGAAIGGVGGVLLGLGGGAALAGLGLPIGIMHILTYGLGFAGLGLGGVAGSSVFSKLGAKLEGDK